MGRRGIGTSALLLAATGAIAVAAWRWNADAPTDGAPTASAAASAVSQVPASPQASEAAARPSAGSASTAQPPPDARAWRQLYAAPDLFARLLQLQQARSTGSFAAFRAIVMQCQQATLAVELPAALNPLQNADANQPNYRQRLAAQEQLASRCAFMHNGSGIDLDVPAGDTEGRRYLDAILTLQDPRGKSAQDLRDAMAELNRQGHPEEMLKFYGRVQGILQPRAAGQGDDENALSQAISIATLRFTALDGGPSEQDLRLAYRCFIVNDCSYHYDDVSLVADPRLREKILKKAAELEAALRSPDPVTALFGPS